MTPEQLDQLAIEIARKYEQENIRGMSFCDTAEELCRRYRAALKEKMKPMAHIHRTGSNVIECIYKGALCPADGHQLLSNDLPLNKSVPLYSLEGW